jgi:hypothetical protein
LNRAFSFNKVRKSRGSLAVPDLFPGFKDHRISRYNHGFSIAYLKAIG